MHANVLLRLLLQAHIGLYIAISIGTFLLARYFDGSGSLSWLFGLEKYLFQLIFIYTMHHALYASIFTVFIVSAHCAKILGIFPSPGYSQFILGEKLMTELARRSHDVTVISPYQPREMFPNYRTVLTEGLVKGPQVDLFPRESEGVISRISGIHELGFHLTEYTLSHPDVQKLLHSNESFDLVIAEQFANEALMGFGPHFNAPIILFSSIGLSEWNSHLMGDIRLPSIVPLSKTEYTDRMGFFQRLVNSLVNVGDVLYKEFVSYPQQQEYLDKYFPEKINLKDIIYNASLMLLNSHVITTQPTSLTTAVVEIGGFHVSPKKLPDHLQQYLDGAKDGAIMFSMGTNLNMSNLSHDQLMSVVNALAGLKQKVLWKLEKSVTIPNKPDNVLISQWLPQSDILGHPNVVAFITHGGLLSVTEATFHGVPMVGVPVFGDQRMNVARCVEKGIAIHLPLPELLQDKLPNALKEILENPKYLRNARKLANIFRDQPIRPLDLAMYWIEYVIRHEGAHYLRNASLSLYWFQLYLIDIIAFLIFCPTVCLYVLFKLKKNSLPRVQQSSSKKNKQKRQ